MTDDSEIGGTLGPQVIVQAPAKVAQSYDCIGYRGVPVVTPAYIAVLPVNSTAAWVSGQRIGDALRNAVGQVAFSGDHTVPCGGSIQQWPNCHAVRSQNCQVLAVLVGDGSTTVDTSTEALINSWQQACGARLRVLPVFPANANPSALLPPSLSRLNAEFWSKSEDEVLQTVLATAGLVPEDFRVFISYKRAESSALALQLFDALTHAQFDVFLDRFGVPRAVDFQHRLEDELARKSMVVLIESDGILSSAWTRFEIDFAKAHRLGILALHPEGGCDVPGVGDDARMRLAAADFVGGQIPNGRDPTSGVLAGNLEGVLTASALDSVVQRVKAAHTAALFRRRRYLRRAMRLALRWMGAGPSQLTSAGLLEVTPGPSAPKQNYAVWLTTRPPDTDDFHITDTRCDPATGGCGAKGVIVGPAAFREVPRRQRTEWLSGRSQVRYFDEGEMLWVAADIAAGRL